MNLDLLESFGQNYPEEFDGSLDCISLALTCCFNKRGTLLAVGCNDGRVIVWDFLTRGVGKVVTAHVHPICSISWSRTGRKLLSASTDNNVCIWDILTGECIQKYRFPCPIIKIQFDPRNEKRFLICPVRHSSLLVNDDGDHEILPIDDDGDLNIIASFDRRGQYVYTGNSKGRILVMNSNTFALKASFRITVGTSSATAIKSIEFARRGDCFLVNTADRVIRVYDAKEVIACGKDGEPEPIQKLQDLVNKTMWKKCTFSGDGEYICAGSARQHALYVWEKSTGSLVKILHGTKGETLLDVVWHPVRPIIASISSGFTNEIERQVLLNNPDALVPSVLIPVDWFRILKGVVSVWAQNQVENWSAFAPDFKELDENVEYDERESEFDIQDEDKSVDLSGEAKHDEDLEVDVSQVDAVAAFCSSDEECEDTNALHFLPIAPEVEDPEEWDTGITPQAASNIAAPVKKPVCSNYEIQLKGAFTDEQHPLLNAKAKDKQSASGGKKAAGRPRK